MTPIHPSQVGRCHLKRTVLLVGEGAMEVAFFQYLVRVFVERNGPVTVKVENASGGSPGTMIATTRKFLRQRAFGVCLILMDTDRPWPENLPAKIGGTRIVYVRAEPVFEGLLVRILNHSGITSGSSVDECKRALYGNYLDKSHRTDSRAFAKHFTKDLVLQRRVSCSELDSILRCLE